MTTPGTEAVLVILTTDAWEDGAMRWDEDEEEGE